MLKQRHVRLVLGIGLVFSAAALTTGGSQAAPASARPPVACKFVFGAVGDQITLSECSHKAQTGGSGTLQESTFFWASGKITTVSPITLNLVSSDEKEWPSKRCPTETQEYILSGTVAADTTGVIPVGGQVSGEVCVLDGFFGNEPGARLSFG